MGRLRDMTTVLSCAKYGDISLQLGAGVDPLQNRKGPAADALIRAWPESSWENDARTELCEWPHCPSCRSVGAYVEPPPSPPKHQAGPRRGTTCEPG